MIQLARRFRKPAIQHKRAESIEVLKDSEFNISKNKGIEAKGLISYIVWFSIIFLVVFIMIYFRDVIRKILFKIFKVRKW
jgi:mannose/fructose/N-acetylgalactosamine-specific phosphotransferase system component IIC